MANKFYKVEAMSEQPDLPKKNAVAGEPSHLANAGSVTDMGAAVVSPTDGKKDAAAGINKVSDAVNAKAADGHQTKSDTEAGVTKVSTPGQTLNANNEMPGDEDDKEEIKAAYEQDEKSDDEKSKEEVKEQEGDEEEKKDKDAESMKEEDEEDSEAKKKEDDADVKEAVAALLGNEAELSEEFKDKAKTVFETAYKAKVKKESDHMKKDMEDKLSKEKEAVKEELTQKVDSYLSYVVEEWMKENELAIERGLKGEIAEDFISGLKKLFEDHYIDVPNEKYDVLEDQARKIEDLNSKLNEEIEKNVELNSKIGEFAKNDIFEDVASDLAETAKEKFSKLAENIDYKTADDYRKKLETVKESYFPKTVSEGNEIDNVAAGEEPKDLTNAMAAYSAAITKTKSKNY
jgi:hypothetical protein